MLMVKVEVSGSLVLMVKSRFQETLCLCSWFPRVIDVVEVSGSLVLMVRSRFQVL